MTWLEIVLSILLAVMTACVVWFAFLRGPYREAGRPQASTTDPEPEADDLEPEAKAIDPENPPRYVIYRPRSGGVRMGCTCHERTLKVGEKVLLWPIPGHPDGGMDIFCVETYGVAP